MKKYCPYCQSVGRTHSYRTLLCAQAYRECISCRARTEIYEAFWCSDVADKAERAWNRGQVYKN